jgi:hypothetical protein
MGKSEPSQFNGLALSVFASQIHLAPRFVAYATSLPSWGESVKGRGKSFTVTFLALPLGELARST